MLVRAIGQKATHTISNRLDGSMDAYPCVVVDIVPGVSPTGIQSPIATIIVERQNLAGESYLAQQDVPVRFLLPRYTTNEALDGKAVETLVEEFVVGRLAFIQKFAQDQSVAALATEIDAK